MEQLLEVKNLSVSIDGLAGEVQVKGGACHVRTLADLCHSNAAERLFLQQAEHGGEDGLARTLAAAVEWVAGHVRASVC